MNGDELKLRFALLVVSLGLAWLADTAPDGVFKFSSAFTAISLLVIVWAPFDLTAVKKPRND